MLQLIPCHQYGDLKEPLVQSWNYQCRGRGVSGSLVIDELVDTLDEF